MTTTASAFHARIKSFLADKGATSIRLVDGGKHPKIVFAWQGRERRYVVPGTPSDARGVLNAESDLRHMLGLVEPVKTTGARRARLPKPAAPTRCAKPEASQRLASAPGLAEQLQRHPIAAAYRPATMRRLAADLDRAWLAYWRGAMVRAGGESVL